MITTTSVEEDDAMSPEEKIKAYFIMNGTEAANRELFDEIVHPDFVQLDAPAGIRIEGKETAWQMMDIPAEHKTGPDTFAYGSEFFGYIGDEHKGFARWSFRPTGKFALLWGLDSVVFEEADAPEIEIAIKVDFKDGKIIRLEEFWNPVPLLQQFGLKIPSPGLHHLQ